VALLSALFVQVSFFFQAEDGIRDRNVTGVQTCALPILTIVGILEFIASFLSLVGVLFKEFSCNSPISPNISTNIPITITVTIFLFLYLFFSSSLMITIPYPTCML